MLASQSSVNDLSTAELMAAFFGEIAAAERQGKAVNYALALRDGKRAVRHQSEWSDPYYWAPFVLAGKQ